MRLIDADALKPHEQLEPMGNGKYEYVEVVYKDDIDDAPTIEAEPSATCDDCIWNVCNYNKVDWNGDWKKSRRGKWIIATGMMPPEFHGHHCCSECGNFANMEPPFGNREDLSKFCPHCGAKMKGADDE